MDGYTLNTAVAGPRELLFLPLGGAGEIGMNLSLYGYGGQWLMVDLGVSFGEDAAPGVDVVMPDPSFIEERRGDLVGLVLTHAHEDHIGAVQYLWRRLRCPVYATPFTASVLRRKLKETGLEREVPIKIIPLSGRFALGPFDLELITLTHSVPEPSGLIIRTPAGTIFHSGDWKLDPDPLVGPTADLDALRRLGEEGVLALVCDSTNVFREGEAGSEASVRDSLVELVGTLDNRVAITCFASNIARLESAYHAARANGRHAALVGRSLKRMDEAARENGYLKDLPPFLGEEAAALLDRDKVLMLVTGSQGEPRAALSRIALDDHPQVELEEGDAVIFSSRIIPGNEKAIGKLHDQLLRLGVEVITEDDHFVHVSGHPARDELQRMYGFLRPRIAIPVHGELRHLHEHATFAKSCQVSHAIVPSNGAVIRLAPGEPAVIDHVPAGKLALDGNRVVAIDAEPLRERARMVHAGFAVASLVLDKKGDLLVEPVVTLHGLSEGAADGALLDRLVEKARDSLEALPASARRDETAVRDAVRMGLRRILNAELGRKPVTEVHVVRVKGG